MRRRALTCAVALSCIAPSGLAQTVGGQSEAAQAFDHAVALFQKGSHGPAAREFLRADAARPSVLALKNALIAAGESHEPVLVATAAERVLARSGVDRELEKMARAALARVSQAVALVDLSCDAPICQIELDGELVAEGQRYLAPGTHLVIATAPGRTRDEQRVSPTPGGTQRLVLQPTPSEPPQASAEPAATTLKRASAPPPEGHVAEPKHAPKGFNVPKEYFYAGVALTVVLAGITTWSGIDTMSARSELPARPSSTELDAVESRITRSNVLFAATVVSAGATAYVGLGLVDWRRSERASGQRVPAMLSVGGKF